MHNAALNSVFVECKALDWSSPHFISADLIVMSDVVWVSHLVEPLVRTLSVLLTPSNSGLIVHKHRSKFVDDKLTEALSQHLMEMSLLDTVYDYSVFQVKLQSK